MKTIYYPGWGVVWKIYSRENLKKSIWLPLVLTVVSFAICFFSGKASLDLIEYVYREILSDSPDIAIANTTMRKHTEPMKQELMNLVALKKMLDECIVKEGKDYSLFQSLNTIFAVVLGMMFLTTIVGAFACIVVKAEISLPEAWSSFINAYNWVCLFVLMFLMYYTINAIKDVVINIFNFGQYVQVYAEKQKMMR